MRASQNLITGLAAILVTACTSEQAAPTYSYSCDPAAYEVSNVAEMASPDDHVLALADCLKDTDPAVRDGKAYETLTAMLRSGEVSEVAVRNLQSALLAMLDEPDPSGVGAPFAALVLSEVARVDRVSPYLTGAERAQFVRAAADYVSGVTDYRGFIDGEGWRHGVAHGADWLMQLALNPNVSDTDLMVIRNAVTAQIRADGSHAYIHGEPARLARPVLFIARRGVFDEAEWTAWLAEISAPAPMETWNAAFKSESGLAQRHNVNAFLNVLYVNADNAQDDNIRMLLPGIIEGIKSVP